MTVLVVRPLDAFVEQRAAAELYRSVFGYADHTFAVSPRLLRGLLDNGGSALGAFDAEDRLLGFCYGFTAVEKGRLYHYSQATVVAPEAQGAGIGGRLKRAQAETARSLGAATMRWTFDPVLARNAHFNLHSLGAVGVRFLPRFYDEPDTDRMLVEWPLDPVLAHANRERAARLVFGGTAAGGADREDLRRLRIDPTQRDELARNLAALLSDGFQALACAPGTSSTGTTTAGTSGTVEGGGPESVAHYIFGRP